MTVRHRQYNRRTVVYIAIQSHFIMLSFYYAYSCCVFQLEGILCIQLEHNSTDYWVIQMLCVYIVVRKMLVDTDIIQVCGIQGMCNVCTV